MKDFVKLQNECINELQRLGITLGNVSSWAINSRAKSRWGLCKLNKDNTYTIEISSRLLSDDTISEKSCKETIIHELLHTCKDCMKHTGKWRQYAEVVNNVYGYSIKRVTSSQEKGIPEPAPKPRNIKYTFVCNNCGATIYRMRESKFTKNYKQYGCARCGTFGAFKKIQ